MNTKTIIVPAPPEGLWRKDGSLCRAAEMMDRMGSRLKAVSFDFFDTIVWRLVGRPTDVFQEIGLRLERAGALRPGVPGSDFEVLRRVAEIKTREKQNIKDASREDITLPEIYQQLKHIVTDLDAAVKLERSLESDVCLLNPGMVEFIHFVKQRGLRAVVVSDIYFSEEELREILRANHFDPTIFEFVFTSADAGVCKGTGNLFRLALKKLGLEAAEILHVGDNYHPDVAGARRAGVQGVHYATGTPEMKTILDRERVLLGGRNPVFNVNSLRLLAAGYFSGDAPEAFFARSGALTMGPILSRFASWACEQYVKSGIRKVGAFMREGDLFAQTLQREADARGFDLEVKPLFVNRKATALAAMGRLTADGLMHWLESRVTLTVRRILEDLGCSPEEIRRVPCELDKPAKEKETVLSLAKYLFQPDVARRIEARSAEERRKVMDYLRPWIEEDNAFGVCDIGYSGSAQMQLMRIFELEGSGTRMVGCYLATYEKAAERVLNGMDVRHFLGAYSKPDFYFRTFIRAPGFLEQSIVAPSGTTLGYHRNPDGSVIPVTDAMPFDDDMLRRQKAFKEGVLLYQQLWLSFRAAKPSMLDGKSEFSARVLADLDLGLQPVLARSTAFPLPSEIAHFGSLPLDDYYYSDTRKTMCSPGDRALLREMGYAGIFGRAGLHWPQATYAQEHPEASAQFFSYAKAFLLCNFDGDNGGAIPALTVFVRARRDPAKLGECLRGLAKVGEPKLSVEVVICVPKGAQALSGVGKEFALQHPRFRIRETANENSLITCMNDAADASNAPFVLFVDEETRLAAAWEKPLMAAINAQPDIAAVIPTHNANPPSAHSTHCLLVRRNHFIAGLGFQQGLGAEAATLALLLRLRDLGFKTIYSAGLAMQTSALPIEKHLAHEEISFLRNRWPDFAGFLSALPANEAPEAAGIQPCPPPAAKLTSIIIPAHNQLRDTQQCLASIEKYTPPAHELILVDNGSTDGTTPFFRKYAEQHQNVRIILNGANLGFSGGNNQGLACAQGEYIVLLNNDTVVTQGWLENMLATLQAHPECGMAGPVSNNISGPQLVTPVGYSGLEQLPKFAAQRALEFAGKSTEAKRLVGFCLMFRRAVLEKIGGLDAQFGNGNFEDDDYCIRATLAGFKARIALDSFVHHTGGQTFKGAKIDYRASLARNWDLFKAKWAMPKDAAMERGYSFPTVLPQGQSLRLPLPELKGSHTPTLEGRCWADKMSPVATGQKISRQAASIALPRCAMLGHLGEARELVRKRQWIAAWTAALSTTFARPYHPEAYLLLAEIAQAVGDANSARLCATAARNMAPNWAPPKQFLKGNLRGSTKPDWLKLPAALTDDSAKPRISVCLIAKNEEKFIGQCIRSVKSVATQIVVVDTGSTDRTVEIAGELGAEIHTFTWCDDFSAARNAAIERATGDWILILDADEELKPGQAELLMREIRDSSVLGYRMPIVDSGREESGCSYVPRLFRNAPGIFFIGRVHEQAFSSIQVRCQQWGLKHALGKTALLHHGYTDAMVQSRNKIERNLRLLEKAIEEMPGEPNLIMSLGLELVRSGKVEEGLDRYWEALRLMSAQPEAEVTPELRETLLTQLPTHLMAAKKFGEIVQLWQSPFAKRAGMTASQHFCLGLAQMELKQPADAVAQMRQCLVKRTRPALSPINPEILKAGPHHCLALCLIALNDAEGARQAFAEAIAADPKSSRVRFDLARLLAAQGQVAESLKWLRQLASENPKEPLVWELGAQAALSRPEFLPFAFEWTAEAVQHFPSHPTLAVHRAETLLYCQRFADAAGFWRKLPASPRQRAAVVLCELLTDGLESNFLPAEEPAISREILNWYRQSIRVGAHGFINHVHERLETIRLTLPSFVKTLEAAHRQARQAAA